MDYTVFKAKILTKSSIGVANASLFEILYVPITFVDNQIIPTVGVLTEPKKMKSFIVILPCFSTKEYFQMISLPGFQSETTFHNFINLKREPQVNGKITINFATVKDVPFSNGICKALWANEDLGSVPRFL